MPLQSKIALIHETGRHAGDFVYGFPLMTRPRLAPSKLHRPPVLHPYVKSRVDRAPAVPRLFRSAPQATKLEGAGAQVGVDRHCSIADHILAALWVHQDAAFAVGARP